MSSISHFAMGAKFMGKENQWPMGIFARKPALFLLLPSSVERGCSVMTRHAGLSVMACQKPISMTHKKTSRDKVLNQWKRVDTQDEERRRAFQPKESSELMEGVLQTMRMDERSSETQILKAWNQLLDPTLTEHAQPVGIRKGTLFVNVDHPTWLSEIVRYRRVEILERLQHCFGKDLVQRISYRIG